MAERDPAESGRRLHVTTLLVASRRALDNGTTVIKYGVDIGKTIAPVQVGEHTHVQNLRTKRW